MLLKKRTRLAVEIPFPKRSPVLPANGPILRALALPTHCGVLDGDEGDLAARLCLALPNADSRQALIRIAGHLATSATQEKDIAALRDLIAHQYQSIY